MFTVARVGKNPPMRRLRRAHTLSVVSLHEITRRPEITPIYEETSRVSADIITKAVTDVKRWLHALALINNLSAATKQ
eukprot:11185890-Lingulodinium_polyedra.AAC.1